MKTILDFRSDTVTVPSPGMRRAMYEAEVGDDVFGDDPTVNRLEARMAETLGKEAGLFVPSGTMGNLLALLTHTRPGDEILVGDESHIVNYEVGGVARLANLQTHTLKNAPDGSMDVAEVAASMRESTIHSPGTTLFCLENTHNRCGGSVLPAATMDALAGAAKSRGVSVHLDGARIFNAQVALNTPAARLAQACDTVSACLSKGLGCPVGTVLCGPAEFIERARRNRKMLGGGMRQVGILAAAGLYALDNNVERLANDHANAKALAASFARFDAFAPIPPESNIVVIEVRKGSPETWLTALENEGVRAVGFGATRIRLVTHLDVTADDVVAAGSRLERAVQAVGA